ncbi:MAG TPA: ATP-binding protein [Gemmatimonadaceae bacterium]
MAMVAIHDGKVDILLVDDRPDQILALEGILAPLGQNLVAADSGEAALRELLKRDVAVILLDVRMAGMSGLETAEIIKERERTRFIPIIFLTGMNQRDDEDAIARAYSAGAVDYMQKPLQPEILRSKVSTFVELYRQQQRLTAQEQQIRQSERQALELEHARELLQSEEKYREILAAALDAIVLLDGDGKITMVNQAAERMFGVRENEAIGAPIGRFILNGDDLTRKARPPKAQPAKPTNARAAGGPRAYVARRANGEEFPIETSVSCLGGADAASRRVTLIARDVSERERQAAALQNAMSVRSRFFASASHELRTPINAVLGYMSLLLEGIYGPLNQQQKQSVERSERATRHLLELVNDVLDLSKIEAGKVDLSHEDVSVPDIVEDIFVTVRPLADERGSSLSVEHEGEPVVITSDPRRVRQILLNLLSNALKFGEGKPVRVLSRPRVDASGEIGVSIDVVDEGIGIPREDQERLFQEFEQMTDKTQEQGTGLGLAISRRLAEMLGGSLTVDSELGKGSRFCLTLPARPPETPTNESH